VSLTQTPAAEDDTRSQSGRPASDGGQDRDAGEDNPRQGPGLPGAGSARGAQPPPPQDRCGYCRRLIHKQRDGSWYHNHNASVFCKPGDRPARKAFRGADR
jgi:hypothetical protein